MKKFIFTVLFSLVFSFGLISCVNHDIDPMNNVAYYQAQYKTAFVKTFGQPAPSQTWGFGTSVMKGVRAPQAWTDDHDCDWLDVLKFDLPNGADKMTAPGWLSTGVYVVPTDGSVSLGWANFNAGDKIYILGNVTELKEANYNGKVTFYIYEDASLTYSVSSGGRHTIINTGTLTINNYANAGEVYNSGTLNLVKEYNPYWDNPNAKADIPNEMSIFSTGDGSVLMPDGGDFKAAADIHGTLVADANTKIQNSETQYICGVKVDGVLDMTEGHLQASMIEADEIDFDGAQIWLTPGGHVKADVIRMPNSATFIFGESTSTGLIEVKDIYLGNTNNFEDTFTPNIYFKITGEIDFANSTKFGGKGKHYANVEAYNNENTVLRGYNSSDAAAGSPACGQPWSVGNKTEFTFLCRVMGEDLSVGSDATDFDFNDIVFDVWTDNQGNAKIKVQAAGGTLPLYINDSIEVHSLWGESTTTMINTGKGPELGPRDINGVVTGIYNLQDVNDKIKISVNKGGAVMELTALQGQPAAKFAVPDSIAWCAERQPITNVTVNGKVVEGKYPKFAEWVKSDNPKQWWKE